MTFLSAAKLRPALFVAALLVPSAAHCLEEESPPLDAATGDTSKQRIQAVQGEIIKLQRQLLEFRALPEDERSPRREMELEAHLADRSRLLNRWQSSSESGDNGAVDVLKKQLIARDDALAEMKIRLQAAYEQFDESVRARELPKLENATVKVFQLKYLQATIAAQTITSILGEREVRVAPDDRANALVVAADEESAKLIEALLMQLDVDSAEPDNGEKPAVVGSQARSLLLRTYWLADGLPEDEGEDASQFLPVSVLKAMAGLGLKEPRLVCQTVNSVSRAGDDQPPSSFETNVPAVVLKQQARLKCGGLIRALHGDRADIEARIEVQSPMFTSELSGSLAMPLGHYMVLGTANSVSFDPAQLSGGGMAPGMEGMGMPMGRGGDAFADATVRGGGRGGEFGGGGPGAAVDPATGMPAGVADAQYNTSHFAFVVQINEAESFAEEK